MNPEIIFLEAELNWLRRLRIDAETPFTRTRILWLLMLDFG